MMQPNEICLPESALGEPAATEGEGMVAPEGGETVDVNAQLEITRREDGKVYARVTSVNGQPVEGGMETESEQSTSDQLEDAREELSQSVGGGM